MKITNIRWIKWQRSPADNILGMCEIHMDNELVIHEIRVIRGHERIFVAYPNKEYQRCDRSGVVRPKNDFARRKFERWILKDFERAYIQHYNPEYYEQRIAERQVLV